MQIIYYKSSRIKNFVKYKLGKINLNLFFAKLVIGWIGFANPDKVTKDLTMSEVSMEVSNQTPKVGRIKLAFNIAKSSTYLRYILVSKATVGCNIYIPCEILIAKSLI